jgi:hypothetical protein
MDASRSRDVRLTALRALTGYFDPSILVTFRIPDDTGLPGAAFVAFGRWAHPHGRDGAEPLQRSIRTDLLGSLKELEAAAGDPVIAKIAGHVHRRLPGLVQERRDSTGWPS